MIRLFTLLAFIRIISLPANEKKQFEDDILAKHNSLRTVHKAPAMKWSSTLQAVAQEWANKIAKENKMYHRNPNEYGENIYWSMGRELSGANVTQSWYDEIKDYKYVSPGFSMKTGHFTQVVWVSSTELGCAYATAKDGGIYVVCNYNPPGNYEGEYKTNVLPKGK